MSLKTSRIALLVSLLVAPVIARAWQDVVVYSTTDDGVTAPVVLTQVDPYYTPAAMLARIQGSVLLSTVVLADGTVGDVRVVESLDAGLDQRAVEAMKAWKFKPGTKEDKAVAVRVRIAMRFTLR